MSFKRAWVGVVAAVALTAGGSAPAVLAAPAGHSTGGGDGLAQRFVSAGKCDGGPRSRVAFHNVTSNDGRDYVTADVTIRRAGKRAAWSFNTEATTTFADGTGVTGIGDFGAGHSNRQGVLKLSAATPFGVHHSIEIYASRDRDGAACRIRVVG